MRDTNGRGAIAADLRETIIAAETLAAMVRREFVMLGDDGVVLLLNVGLRILAFRLAGIARRAERRP